MMDNMLLSHNHHHLRDDDDEEYNDNEARRSSSSTSPSVTSSSSRFENILRLIATNAVTQLSRYHDGGHILPTTPTQPLLPFPPRLMGENSRRYQQHDEDDDANSSPPQVQRRRLIEIRLQMIEDALDIINDEGTTSSSSLTSERVQQQDNGEDDVDVVDVAN